MSQAMSQGAKPKHTLSGEEIIRAERAVLQRMHAGEQLLPLTNHAEHVARLDAGEDSRLLLDG